MPALRQEPRSLPPGATRGILHDLIGPEGILRGPAIFCTPPVFRTVTFLSPGMPAEMQFVRFGVAPMSDLPPDDFNKFLRDRLTKLNPTHIPRDPEVTLANNGAPYYTMAAWGFYDQRRTPQQRIYLQAFPDPKIAELYFDLIADRLNGELNFAPDQVRHFTFRLKEGHPVRLDTLEALLSGTLPFPISRH